jgi:hypothetical protein
MAVTYTCPNPDCGATLKTANRVQTGKSVKCPKCKELFVAEPQEDDKEEKKGPGVFKLADDPSPPKKPAKPGTAKTNPKDPPLPPKTEPAKKDDDDEDAESIKKGYGVIHETEAEIKEAEKNKPKFTEVQDKFKKSARGPAQALLVMPSQLLTFEGLLTGAGGILIFVIGMWPLVFNDAPPGEEEAEEAFQYMAGGLFILVWGVLVCYGASEMHELGSYIWSMVGSVLGIFPILVGIFGIVMLRNPKVLAGFEEGESGPNSDEDEDKDGEDDDDDEDDEDEDEDEDEDDEDKPKKKKPARMSDED